MTTEHRLYPKPGYVTTKVEQQKCWQSTPIHIGTHDGLISLCDQLMTVVDAMELQSGNLKGLEWHELGDVGYFVATFKRTIPVMPLP